MCLLIIILGTNNAIGIEGGRAICELLSTNTSIIKLDLGVMNKHAIFSKLFIFNIDIRNQFGDYGARAIGEALRVNTSITDLNLWNELIDITLTSSNI